MRFALFSPGNLAYKWWVTIAVTLGMLMSLMDATIVNVAIPQMQHAFGASIHDVQWVVTIYMLTQAVTIPTAPYLAKRLGNKYSYIWMLSAFLLGSLLCGFAWNLPSLVFFRFVQGIGGGIMLPMIMSLQYQAFPPQERGVAASVMSIPLTVAPMLGPIVGGYLVTDFGWQWAFFINVPIGIIALTIALKVLRQSLPPQHARFDLAGFLTAALGCAALIYSVSMLSSGATTLPNLLCLCAGVLLLLLFGSIELRKARLDQEPLLDLRHLQHRTFAFSVLALVFFSMVYFGVLFLIPVYLQSLHQQNAFQAGMLQTAQALATLAVLPFAGRFSDRIGPRFVVIIGLTLMIGTALLMTTLTLTTALPIVVAILALFGASNALSQQIPVSAMSNISQDEPQAVAHGSTLVTVLRAIAAPTGVALLSNIVQNGSQHYTASLAAQGLTGALLARQSTLLAMHQSFLLALGLLALALLSICLVPRRKLHSHAYTVPTPSREEALS
jgi:EmrB/QacA subfamily drug resistance transporter